MGRKWGRTRAIYEDHMDDIVRDFKGGAELREIATKYDVSPPTIANWLIKAGYKHRKKGRYPNAMKQNAVELEAEGWEPIAIANLFEVKLPYVLSWLGREPEGTGIYSTVAEPELEPEYTRHVTGRRWTRAQKERVVDLVQSGIMSVAQIYRITNASRVRQQRIWSELVGTPFPLAKESRRGMTRAEIYHEGKMAGLEEARQAALEAGQEVTALVRVEEASREMDDAAIEAEFERFEALKRMLDEGRELEA